MRRLKKYNLGSLRQLCPQKFFLKRMVAERKRAGLTLIELLISFAVLVTAVSGILLSYLRCLELNEIARNLTLSTELARARMETVKSTTFDQIKLTYDLTNFPTPGMNGRGAIYVNDANPDLLQIIVSVSWQQKNGRIYGEDKNLNGVLNVGEDTNGNSLLDSPVQLVSSIYRR
jgi:Tfp pilus assembly protein PilV